MSEPNSPAPRQDLVIKALPPELAELLQQIPACPELSEDAAQNRLFPSPGEADDGHFAEEWKGLVEPDLQNQFLSDRLTVATDLTRMKEGPQGWTLTIPPEHVEAWISALTQVRLAIAAAHQLGEEEITLEEMPEKNPALARVLQRVHFYGIILEMLVRVAENTAPTDAASSSEEDLSEEWEDGEEIEEDFDFDFDEDTSADDDGDPEEDE